MRQAYEAKVTCLTPGGLASCHEPVASQGAADGRQKSAEAVVAHAVGAISEALQSRKAEQRIDRAGNGERRAERQEPNRHGKFDARTRRRQKG